jgi:hypothetical protein
MFGIGRKREESEEPRLTMRLARMGFLQEILAEDELPQSLREAYASELVILNEEVRETLKTSLKRVAKVVGVVTVAAVAGGVVIYLVNVKEDDSADEGEAEDNTVVIVDPTEIIEIA